MTRFRAQKLLFLLLCQAWISVYAAGPKQTTVTIRVHNNADQSVSLYQVENGEAVMLGFRWPKADTCSFSFPMEKEGIYFLHKGGGAHEFSYVIYLKPGDNKSIEAYSNKLRLDFDSCKIVDQNPETDCLQKWMHLLAGITKLGQNRSQRSQFIAEYYNLVKETQELKKASRLQNKYFNYLLSSKIDADIAYLKAAAFFFFGPRMNAGCDTTSERKKFYESMSGQKFCSAGILNSEHGMDLVKMSLGYNLFYQSGSQAEMLAAPFVGKAKSICNDTVRRVFVADRMFGITNYEQFSKEIEPFNVLFTSGQSKQIYQKKKDELTVYAKGATAYNFSLKDTKDKTVSLSDFKGKVVVLDIWAMWCAPCLAEKPIFEKLEEEFKERGDVVFIGISHDGLARKEVWKDFVAKKGWQSIELLANFDESIGKYYKVDGIPRFMIFDKEGKIVTVDAPRPSHPDFKKLIEQTLKDSKS